MGDWGVERMKQADMTAAAKFRVICDRCGKSQPRATTATTSQRWMAQHEGQHRENDAAD